MNAWIPLDIGRSQISMRERGYVMSATLDGEQLLRRSELWRLKAEGDMDVYRVAESPRDMPCDHWVPDPVGKKTKAGGTWVPCRTRIRVKVKEPGEYAKLCGRCGNTTWYHLIPSAPDSMVLLFRWMTPAQIEARNRALVDQLGDLVL